MEQTSSSQNLEISIYFLHVIITFMDLKITFEQLGFMTWKIVALVEEVNNVDYAIIEHF